MFREASTNFLAEARNLVGPSAHPHPDIRMVDVIIHFRYSGVQRLVTRAQHGSDETFAETGDGGQVHGRRK